MTPSELRAICDRLNPGGQSKLARMLPGRKPGKSVSPRTVRRWLAGKKDIPPLVEIAIRQATETLPEKCWADSGER
jgi:hypothetical protein